MSGTCCLTRTRPRSVERGQPAGGTTRCSLRSACRRFRSVSFARRSETAAITAAAHSAGGWCSQKRSTSHPSSMSRSSVFRSRVTFPPILDSQYEGLVFGGTKCSGQPCQKQPSIKTATRTGRKTRSAVRRIFGSGFAATRYRNPAACTSERSASSGDVSRLRFPSMLRRFASDDAHDPSGAFHVSAFVWGDSVAFISPGASVHVPRDRPAAPASIVRRSARPVVHPHGAASGGPAAH